MRDIVFQQSVFQREKLIANWPDFNNVISSGNEVAAAFEIVQDLPMWKEDPRLADLPPKTAREILDIYNEVIADGRYVRQFVEDPASVAKRLDLKISSDAVEVIELVALRMVGSKATIGAAIVVISISVVAIAVGTAIVSSRHLEDDYNILVDESGLVKLGDEFSQFRERANRRKAARPGIEKKPVEKKKKTGT